MTEDGAKQAILVVDDTPLNIDMIKAALSDTYFVQAAVNGKMALKIIDKKMPDLILLDIMMPEMDGYEVCKRLKSNAATRDIPVIFLTAKSEEGDESGGLELGAIDYITKPFNPKIVRLRVENHLELKRQRDVLAKLADIDGLTCIANRRAFDEYLEKEWLRSQRSKKPLSILMIDVDFFKRYNDLYGHLAGDDCLKTIAGTLEKTLARPADIAARYGGEEFACILPETSEEGAIHTARNILEAVRALKIPHAGSDVFEFVTVSIGTAVFMPDNSARPSALIKAADNALYTAKAEGRNRVKSGRLAVTAAQS